MMLHIDINSYFATMVQQENPQLRGRPVGIIKDLGRTCLIATSKEAKARGVKTGCRAAEARAKIPEIILVPAQFELYLDSTKKLRTLFQSIAPDVYMYSLDEAFIDLSNCETYLHPDVLKLAATLQQQIRQTLGEWVTCNIGISRNRFLAKMASETAKPGSITQVRPEDEDVLLASTTFADVCGIGFGLAKKLSPLGITTPYLIRLCSDEELTRAVGPFWMAELRKMSYGDEPHHLDILDDQKPMHSVGRSLTGFGLWHTEEEIKRVLYNLTEEVTHKVRKLQMAGREVWIGIWGEHHEFWSAHKTLEYYVRHTPEMFDLIYHQLYQTQHPPRPVIKCAVRLSKLRSQTQLTPSLLPSWQKNERISQAMDAIAARYGLFTIRSGIMSDHRQLIRPEVTGYLGDRTYQLDIR